MTDREMAAKALHAAWAELNAIRARDGVPYTFDGNKSGVSEDYFSQVVDDCAAAYSALTGMQIQPWHPSTTPARP